MPNLFNEIHNQSSLKNLKSSQKRVLVIGAHPDDAEIGAAGTLCHLKALNYECAIAIASIGVTDLKKKACRKEVAQAAAKLLGSQLFWPLGESLGHVEDCPSYEIVRGIDQLLSDYAPDIIITHSRMDSHNDHRLLANGVISASRKWFGSIYTMPPAEIGIVDGSEFKPTLFIDTHDFQTIKKQVLDLYNYPDKGYKDLIPNRIAQRDAYYGAFVNQTTCEAFEVVRQMQVAF